jgi:ribosomal protein S18 acetylase RimI-like enzyme
MTVEIQRVGEDDLPDLLPLMRGYCDFYGTAPSDDALLALSRALIADPEREGIQLIARDTAGDGEAFGFATVYWMWSTTRAVRVAVMNDLFVAAGARRRGAGEALIAACLEVARERGAALLQWQTAPDNRIAQALYDRVGGVRESWYDYYLET